MGKGCGGVFGLFAAASGITHWPPMNRRAWGNPYDGLPQAGGGRLLPAMGVMFFPTGERTVPETWHSAVSQKDFFPIVFPVSAVWLLFKRELHDRQLC